MSFLDSDEQNSLREVVAQLLSERSPAQWAQQSDTPQFWKQLGGSLGLAGLAIPEPYGGVDAGLVEATIVMEELGYAVCGGPYLSTAVLAPEILRGGNAAVAAELLTGIAATDVRIAVGWDVLSAGDASVDGDLAAVLDGNLADILLVSARGPKGALDWYAVQLADQSVRRSDLVSLDRSRQYARITLRSTPSRALRLGGTAEQVSARLQQRAFVALAAEQAGGARRCLDDAVAYAKNREQFGRPIGSFQAIKHICATMALQVGGAQVAVRGAAIASSEDIDEAAAVARIYAAGAYVQCARDNLQVHGGIGFTMEADCHWHVRRARANAAMVLPVSVVRDRLAARLLGAA